MPESRPQAESQTGAARRDPTVRNVVLLAVCQALFMSGNALTMTIAALVGYSLAEDKSFATLPVAIQFAAMTATTFPASFLMRRFGRRAGFSLGAVIAVAGALIAARAVFVGSFPLLCLGAGLYGASAAFAFFYRFAAADTASEAFRSRAISLVMAGGVVAAFLGPQLAVWTRELFAPVLFAGGYVAIAALALLSLVILQLIQIPRPGPAERKAGGRPLAQIVRGPTFLVAATSAMVGYGAMNLIMTSTPLAILACDHSFDSAAFVIQWHVVGMFAPSFFTGSLIARFGCGRVIAAGAALILACVLVNLSGDSLAQFWSALVLLGLGWNFTFVGGTTLLTEAYRPEEKAKVQAFNDLLVAGTVAATALASGHLFNALGWAALNLAVLAPVALVLLAAAWLARRQPAPALS